MKFGKTIVTDGLVSYLDAANTKSYPGNGVIWNDIIDNKQGTLINGPSHNNNVISLDGSNDYILFPTITSNDDNAWTADGSVGSSNLCLEIWFKPLDYVGWLISKPWHGSGVYNIQLRFSSNRIVFSIRTTSTTSIVSDYILTDSMTQVVIWANDTQMGYYVNGGAHFDSKNHGQTAGVPEDAYGNQSRPLTIGTLFPYGDGWGGGGNLSILTDIGLIRKYNRVLSQEEILQNYNAQKGRFGL